jgi:hypothetical protein
MIVRYMFQLAAKGVRPFRTSRTQDSVRMAYQSACRASAPIYSSAHGITPVLRPGTPAPVIELSASRASTTPRAFKRYACRGGRPSRSGSSHRESRSPRSLSRIRSGYNVPEVSPVALDSS